MSNDTNSLAAHPPCDYPFRFGGWSGQMAGSGELELDTFLPYRLSVASYAVSEVISSAYRSLFGLTIPEWRLVTVLAARQKASQLQIGAATRMDKVTVSRAAIALTARGLIERSDNPADKRSHLLSLTKTGERLYAEVAPKALALEKDLLAGFSAEERRTLRSMLMRLEQAAAGMTAA